MADRRTDLIIVGGGPSGMMAGLLFARAGVRTLVLEKHGDFLRDFRGDTVHPSTMEILSELGLLESFLERPHNRLYEARGTIAGKEFRLGDLSHLRTPAPFIAMMPQWDFLDFLRDEAERYPTFALEMKAPIASFVEQGDRVTGVRLADGRELDATLTIAADGRSSLAREMLPLKNLGAPMDVFWFRVPKPPGTEFTLRGIVAPRTLMALIDRGDYWQVAYIFAKGMGAELRAGGIEALRARIEKAAPILGPLDKVLTDIEQMHLLTVELDRLERWHRPGLLAIGDAAHAMSPAGGVGINLAIQDAVAAANILAGPFAAGKDVDPLLRRVQDRRFLPTRLIQGAQKRAQDAVIGPVLDPATRTLRVPLAVRLLDRFALLRRIPGRFIGLGVRREHVRSPDAGLRRAGLPAPSPSPG
ncbi:FAD-dependent oxidoreductase [Sphingosinicella sp. YJ22]|uniref:FAD-dependent oxidoreductase n=1 Tax=Sphingosinicella sp. YJ22 TaxID=1104780 RepID=UPI00140A91FA|nr:FAD-dependent oxidoreductase [Sphingosinicella sp. YJ22]